MDAHLGRTVDTLIVPQICSRFGIDEGTLSLVQGDRSFVYSGPSTLGEVVLKVIPSADSYRNRLLGELDWMAHLHANGVRVARPIPSRGGRWIESLTIDEHTFHACCYERVEGPLWQEVRDPAGHVTAVGQLAGRMHAVSIGYTPAAREATRPTWKDAPWFAAPEDWIHSSMPGVIERCRELREAIVALPAPDWGLVHSDLHGGNVVISTDGPAAIDFECCEVSRLVSEVGSALYFWLWKTPDSDPRELAHRAGEFLRAFMRGYEREHGLSDGWLEALPLFLKARELSIFASCGLQREDFETHGRHDPTFAWMKANIEDGVPYVDLDFGSDWRSFSGSLRRGHDTR